MKQNENNLNFEKEVEQTFKTITAGTTVTGTIIEINNKEEIFIDLGYKADGIITRKEYFSENELLPSQEYKVGDKITAEVIKINDGEGNVLMSNRHSKIEEIRKEFDEKVSNNVIFEEKITEVNSNGLIAKYKNLIKIFIPMSLSNISREENVNTYVGKTMKFKVIENEPRKIIGSVRIIFEEAKKEKEDKIWNEIEVGKKYKGIVTSLSDYGAFVDIGGAQGLLHISEITWQRNENARNLLKVGQEIDVIILELDKENRRFKLTYEEKGPNPWQVVNEKYNVGDVAKVEICKLMPFGAFAEIEPGVEGLIHISQICEKRIAKPEEALFVGKKVNAKIIGMDLENKKIELSIKELEGTSEEYSE